MPTAGAGGTGAAPTTVRTGPTLELTVNGTSVCLARRPERTLLDVLRYELGLTGTKYGCGEGECGACTVLLNGEPVSACQVSAGDLAGAAVVTVEGLARGERLSPVQRAFAERGAFQCGFCTPGMVVAMTALLQRNPAPSTDQVRDALQGHLCRCCGYPRILEAAHRASELTRAGEGGP